MPVIYLKSRRRRPVFIGQRPAMEDVMGRIPEDWCQLCGMEIYIPGQWLCPGCMGKEKNNGKADQVSL